MSEPDYYVSNGLSPIGAFKQGLISKDEYRGFLIGNVIKYVVRAGKKDDAIKDLEKAKTYIDFYLELIQKELFEKQCQTKSPMLTIDVNNDIDLDKLEKEITKALKDNYNIPVIMETPTEDPHIVKLSLEDIFYNRDGELTPKAREAVKEYIEKRRNDVH